MQLTADFKQVLYEGQFGAVMQSTTLEASLLGFKSRSVIYQLCDYQ